MMVDMALVQEELWIRVVIAELADFIEYATFSYAQSNQQLLFLALFFASWRL